MVQIPISVFLSAPNENLNEPLLLLSIRKEVLREGIYDLHSLGFINNRN